MSTSPITLTSDPNPPAPEAGVQHSAAAQGSVPAPAAPEPAQSGGTALENAEVGVQGSRQNQIQELFLQGESVSQIASETGLSVSDVDVELDISAVATRLAASGPESAAATAPSSSTASAIATYGAVAAPTGSVNAGQPSAASSGSTLSVEA